MSFLRLNQCRDLRSRLYENREFSLLRAPQCHLYDSFSSRPRRWSCDDAHRLPCNDDSVCMIRRPLCDNFDGSYRENFTDRGFGRGTGGWQRIGYLLPLYVERPQRFCNCSRRRKNTYSTATNWSKRQFPLVRQPSQFAENCNAHAPYDNFDNDHDPHCALFANAQDDEHCQNRQCGVRRYHFYVRVDPERVGQQCFRTSSRCGDHRYNNCRYLQFGVAEEGLHDSAIMIINSDYVLGGASNRLTRSTRCIENGDVIFVPGEQNKKFKVFLYDEQVYDGNCY